jgi:hypothetical protein
LICLGTLSDQIEVIPGINKNKSSQAVMAVRRQIECDIHDLLDEANTLLLSATVDVGKTAGLLGKLRNCADQARDEGLTDSAARMQQIADVLEKKLLSES